MIVTVAGGYLLPDLFSCCTCDLVLGVTVFVFEGAVIKSAVTTATKKTLYLASWDIKL